MHREGRVETGGGKAKGAMLQGLVTGQEGREVADPWYGEADGFTATWAEVDAGARALLAVLLDQTS